MKVKINKPVDVEPAIMSVFLKVRDEFSFSLKDTNSNIIASQEDGCVPNFLPGEDGDYVDLKIDVRTGTIVNWDKLFAKKLQEWLDDRD